MPQVNGDNLLHQQIVKRTIEALQAQDEAFAIEYETASDADLIAYVRQCVDASYYIVCSIASSCCRMRSAKSGTQSSICCCTLRITFSCSAVRSKKSPSTESAQQR